MFRPLSQVELSVERRVFLLKAETVVLVFTDSNCPLAMKAPIDCGTMGEFIDHEFVRAHELQTYQLPCPIRLYNTDGTPNKIGKITEAIELIVQYKGHKGWSKFYVYSLKHRP